MTVDLHMPKFSKDLSYSSLTSYVECPRKWYLKRLERLPDGTWWTTLLGSAIHWATEQVDRMEWMGLGWDVNEAVELMWEEFDRQIADAQLRGLDVRPSGKVLKEPGWTGGPDKKDEAWCRIFGPIMMQRYAEWKTGNGLRIAEIDGQPAIETAFRVTLTSEAGGTLDSVTLRGFIDRIYRRPLHKGAVVVDLKTGKVPTNNLQLETYGIAASLLGLQGPHEGAFWAPGGAKDSDAGKIYGPRKLHGDADILADIYLSAKRGMEARAFPPNTDSYCSTCQVRDYCTAFNGPQAVINLDKWRVERAQRDDSAANSLPNNDKDQNVNTDNQVQ